MVHVFVQKIKNFALWQHRRFRPVSNAAMVETTAVYFEDVGQTLGLDQVDVDYSGWGMGCAVGDYDNDGDVDLYATYWGPNRLYRFPQCIGRSTCIQMVGFCGCLQRGCLPWRSDFKLFFSQVFRSQRYFFDPHALGHLEEIQ